ncbi:uncharacterized protein LOC126373028 isoform X2 [Pectinophora gossypiella]|uniref:uncharacterized protein LOC126373028 isoform X2 n=1 Tax=Pectinophora gossypiella TaxID=13191 RepID=UPI00214E8F06|nr:uncharacterized protein LOC126373028 isoform X2 [Pectinophora gossypiella]
MAKRLVLVLFLVYFNNIISGKRTQKDEGLKLMPSSEVIVSLHSTQVIWAEYPAAIESCRVNLHNKWYQCDPPPKCLGFEQCIKKICLQPDDPKLSWFPNFNEGVCGVILKGIRDKWTGNVTFQVLHKNVSHTKTMRFIVPREPTSSLSVDPVVEDYVIKADCFVINGRPVPNISWLLDNENVQDGLEHPLVNYNPDTDLYSISQRLHLKFDLQLLGRRLTCLVNYKYADDTYMNSYNVLTRQQNRSEILNLEFPPTLMNGTTNNSISFNNLEGHNQSINLVVCANPDIDKYTWFLNHKPLPQGLYTGLHNGHVIKEISQIYLQTNICCCKKFSLLFSKITKELIRSTLTLTVTNAWGKTDINITLNLRETQRNRDYKEERDGREDKTFVEHENIGSVTSAWTVAAYVITPLLLIVVGLGFLYYFYERVRTERPHNNSASSPEDDPVYSYVPIETVSLYSARALIADNRKAPTDISFKPPLPKRNNHTTDYDYACVS